MQQSTCHHPTATHPERRAQRANRVPSPSGFGLRAHKGLQRHWQSFAWFVAGFFAFTLWPTVLMAENAENPETGTYFDEKLLPPWPDESPLPEGPILVPPQTETPTKASWVWVTGQEAGEPPRASQPSGPTFDGLLNSGTPFVYPEPDVKTGGLLIPEDQVFAPDASVTQRSASLTARPTICCPSGAGACRVRQGVIRGFFDDLRNTGRWQRWSDEPGSVGVFLGYGWGTELVNNWLEERDGFWGGLRLGWDCSEQYGLETRLSFGSLDLWDHPNAVAAATGTGPRDRWVRPVEWDVVLMYYPTENDPWRPYVLWGVGLTRVDFADYAGTSYEGTYFSMPLGIGLKFRPKSGPVMRFEIVDQIVFPSRFNTTHHFAFTVGLEMRFGKRRKIYWPWE